MRNYTELIFVDSQALKQAHSKLRNCFSNAVYRQKTTDRNPHPQPCEVYIAGAVFSRDFFVGIVAKDYACGLYTI
jgi:hypothetical protein